MADWSTLPTELLHLISQQLPTSIDLLRFRSVCSSWRSATSLPLSTAHRLPVHPDSGILDSSWCFSLSKRTIYSLQSPLATHSSWVIKLERDNATRIHLLNPLAGSQIKPSPDTFPRVFAFLNIRIKELGDEYALQYINFRPTARSIGDGNLYTERVAVSNNSCAGFVLLTIHESGKLVVFKSGDDKWRLIDDLPSFYDDVILRKGKFYAVDSTGRIVLVNTVDLNVSIVADSISGGDKKFLVDSDGELLLLDMYSSIEITNFNEQDLSCSMSERTVKFKVFRLDEDVGKWIEITDLGDRILFLGDNCTFSALASDIFGDNRRRGNCIIFSDQNWDKENVEFDPNWMENEGVWKNRGIGLFDLESGSIGPIGSHIGYPEMFWPPPDWVHSTASAEAGLNLLNI